MSEAPLVTVLIPARNEEADIARCLEAVLAQDYSPDRMEIVLVDGGSTDATAAVASTVLEAGNVEWRIIDNPTGTTPSNLNAGLSVAVGSIVCRVDARSIVPHTYVRRCVEVLGDERIAVTGGAQIAVPVDASIRAAGIARGLNNRLVMGGARYRSGAPSGPADTVYLGAFRTADVRAVGGWDEAMLSNQDFELNRRISRCGTVWFDARQRVGYLPRRRFADLWQQYFRFGRWKVRYWRHTGEGPVPRQIAYLGVWCCGVGTGLVVLGRTRRPRQLLVPVGAALGLLMTIDRVGSDEDARPAHRGVAAAVASVIASAWPVGVMWETIIGSGESVVDRGRLGRRIRRRLRTGGASAS